MQSILQYGLRKNYKMKLDRPLKNYSRFGVIEEIPQTPFSAYHIYQDDSIILMSIITV